MKMAVERRTIKIIPESDMDEAYLEEVLSLEAAGSQALAVRVIPVGWSDAWAYLEIRKADRSAIVVNEPIERDQGDYR